MPSALSSVTKGRSGGSRRSSANGTKGAPPPPEVGDDDDSMMAEAMAVITEFDQKKSNVAQQQKPSPGRRPNGSPRGSSGASRSTSASSASSSSRKSAPARSSTSSQKRSSPPKPESERSSSSSRRSVGKKQSPVGSTTSPNKRVKNKIAGNNASGSAAAVRRAQDASVAASSSSYRSGRAEGTAAGQRMSVDQSASTFATTHKSSPRTSPDKKKKITQKQQSRKQRSPSEKNDGKLGPALDAMAQRDKVGDGSTSNGSNRATATAAASAASVASANVSVKSALTAATEDVFMSKFVSDPTGETDDAMSKRSLKSNAPSVTASVMLNAIDPSRAASHDCDDTTAFDDGTLTLDGFAVADDSSTLLGDDSSAIDELVQVSSRDSTTFGSRAAPVAAGAAAVAATTAAAATAQPKSTRSMASSIKTRKIKNKHNVTVIGVPSPPPSDSSAAFSATTAGALNGDAASSKVTESTESGHVTPSSPSKLLAPVASTDSDRDGDPSLGAVSSATAASAAARSVLSAQSSRSVRTAQSRVPDIDLNADEGSLNTNMTSATELNRRLKASIQKGKSSKMENIIGVLGEDDPLSKALRDAEDRGVGDVVLASGTAEATAVGKAQTSARSIKSMLSRKSSGSASKRKEANPSPAPVDAAATHPSRPPEQDKDASRAGSMSTSSRFSEQEKAAAVVGAIASSVDGLAESSLALDGSSLADGSSSVANTEPGSSKKAVMRRGLKQATWRRRGTSPPVTPVSEVLFVAVGAWRRPPLLPTAFVMRRAMVPMGVARQMTGH